MTRHGDKYGFTIVELMIVIVVLAILTAIAVVSYKLVIDNSELETAKADARDVAAKLVRYKSDNGSFPTQAVFSGLTLTQNTSSTMTYSYTSANDSFCIMATNDGQSAYATNQSGQPFAGTCP